MPPDVTAVGPAGRGEPTPDERWLEGWLVAARRRWRLWVGLRSVAVAVGVALVARAALVLASGSSPYALTVAMTFGVATALALLLAAPGMRQWRPVVLAAEAAVPEMRNALMTWREMGDQLPPHITARLATHARHSLVASAWPRPHSPVGWTVALVLACAGLLANLVDTHPVTRPERPPRPASDAPAVVAELPLEWTSITTPPAYTGKAPEQVRQAARLSVLAGSRVDIVFRNWRDGARVRLGRVDVSASEAASSSERMVRVMPTESDVLQVEDRNRHLVATITLLVVPDVPPTVRITAPAADLRRSTSAGVVPITITAQDDLGLRDLRLRYTKVSGSGESFTFEDGEWPVQVRRESAQQWNGSHQLDLATMGLGPGDSLVYHAIAHDARVGAEGVAESERLLIEITRPGALAAGEFSLPDAEGKFALSQRMVIQLTERLLETRPHMSPEAFAEEAQVLALAQRRVRAEFVFMLGGEVEDEVEEAAHAHEVEAGRQDNQGKGHLTEAVRQMSQAATRLAAPAPREALPYQYRALAALQAAFGKGRYFMRTLPAAVQIDAARRLQGDRSGAGSARWTVPPLPDAARTAALTLLDALQSSSRPVESLLPELIALDRGNAAWVATVQQAATAGGRDGVSRALRARLLPGSPNSMHMPLARMPAEARVASVGSGPMR